MVVGEVDGYPKCYPQPFVSPSTTLPGMGGVQVAGMLSLTVPPSSHFADHFVGVSDELAGLTADLIDGARAVADDEIEVSPEVIGPTFSRLSVVDLREPPRRRRCYIVSLWARTKAELDSLPSNQKDRAGVPTLLTDFHNGPVWRIYNCFVIVQSWDRDRLLQPNETRLPKL